MELNSFGFHGAAVAGDQPPAVLQQTQQSTPCAVQRTPSHQHSPTAPPDQYSSTTSSSSTANSTPMFAASPAGNSPADRDSSSDTSIDIAQVTVHGAGQRARALKSLKESIPHSMKLQHLKRSEQHHQKEGSWHKRGLRRLSKELYVIVSLYALMQSALFTAVSQTSLLQCEDWWAPLCMSLLVTLATLGSALDKLHRMGQQQQQIRLFEARQSAVYDAINELLWRGAACDLDYLQPQHQLLPLRHPGLLCVFSARGFLILGFLLGFSLLLIVSCGRILCHPLCTCPL
ncbi:hypothetical protein L7F22_020361 [Adiantum nelumboides]|nr:hypothetical protein [Adiantum nelumboides]